MTMALQQLWEVDLPTSVISVATTPGLSLIIAGCVDRKGYALDRNGARLWEHSADNEVWAAACAIDGSVIALGTADKKPAQGKVYLLNRAGDPIATFALGMPVWGLAFDASATRLVASTWGNECHLFQFSSRQWEHSVTTKLPGAGAYGVRWIDEDTIAAVCYDYGVVTLNTTGAIVNKFECRTFGYNMAVTVDGDLFVGTRDSSVGIISSGQVGEMPIPNATRATTALAAIEDGSGLFVGGFDGYLRAITRTGSLLWEKDLIGEVWSTACVPSGRYVVAGVGTGKVVLLENLATIDVLRECYARIADLTHLRSLGDEEESYRSLLTFLSSHGLYRYALGFLRERMESGSLAAVSYAELLECLGNLCPADHEDGPELFFERAIQRRNRQHHWDAAIMYLHASKSKKLRLRAYSEAATEFYRANHPSAALASFRRAREATLTSSDLQLIYNLARSFEDQGERTVARDHLDIILAQDPDYRDVSSRLLSARGTQGFDADTRTDYTGLTVNLLGPDAPTSVADPRIKGVIEARAKEVNVTGSEKDQYTATVQEMFSKGVLTARLDVERVGYDTSSYIKYDFLLPEDDVKKKLEAVNLVNVLKTVERATTTLDVGCATGRYPGILQALGYEAFGVDIEPAAIAYAKSKFPEDSCPVFVVGDVRNLPFEDSKFDFVSCMMGTFYHVPLSDQLLALSQMMRVCRAGGKVAVSVWDLECPHQTFLSMYSVNEEELIVRNSLTLRQMEKLFAECGFGDVASVRLGLVPDTISYDLGVEDLDVTGLRRLLEIDMAARAATPDKHGQMFIAYGTVP
ncbi:MAG TPA: methyltransferase domain-containing protein [Allosphingosinicella sp.]|jgi:SAM-dependent methyltransferase